MAAHLTHSAIPSPHHSLWSFGGPSPLTPQLPNLQPFPFPHKAPIILGSLLFLKNTEYLRSFASAVPSARMLFLLLDLQGLVSPVIQISAQMSPSVTTSPNISPSFLPISLPPSLSLCYRLDAFGILGAVTCTSSVWESQAKQNFQAFSFDVCMTMTLMGKRGGWQEFEGMR